MPGHENPRTGSVIPDPSPISIEEKLRRQKNRTRTLAEILKDQRENQIRIKDLLPGGGGGSGGGGGLGSGDIGDRSGNSQASRILNIRLFKLPNGVWITPRNMASTHATLVADGYSGPWFPTIPGDVPAWMKAGGGVQYEAVWHALREFMKGGTFEAEQAAKEIELPGADDGGDGFGSFGPVYVAPDEAAVREALQGYQVAVTGQLESELLDSAVETYLTTHKKDFDSKGEQHDPFQAAKEIIRGSASYKDIHELRPESDDELAWVTSQQGRLRTLGLTSEQSEQLGIKLARVGASAEGAQGAGEKAFFQSTGRVQRDQRDSLKNTAKQVLSLL